MTIDLVTFFGFRSMLCVGTDFLGEILELSNEIRFWITLFLTRLDGIFARDDFEFFFIFRFCPPILSEQLPFNFSYFNFFPSDFL